MTAAKNICIDYHRTKKHDMPPPAQEHEQSTQCIDYQTPETIINTRQRLAVVESALRELSPLCQEVFYWTRIYGDKQADVAKRLNIHITTVEKNLSRAIHHCHRRLTEMDSSCI